VAAVLAAGVACLPPSVAQAGGRGSVRPRRRSTGAALRRRGLGLPRRAGFLDNPFVRLVFEAPERNVEIGKSGRVRRGAAGARVW